jgi:hypothetical protein
MKIIHPPTVIEKCLQKEGLDIVDVIEQWLGMGKNALFVVVEVVKND